MINLNTIEHTPTKREATLSTSITGTTGIHPPDDKSASKDYTVETLFSKICTSLEDSKAQSIEVIDISKKSSIGDYMIIASGRSHRHVSAICDTLLKDIKQIGMRSAKVEGLQNGDWVLIDAGDIIVHVFRPEVREYYNLEKMWQLPEQSPSTN